MKKRITIENVGDESEYSVSSNPKFFDEEVFPSLDAASDWANEAKEKEEGKGHDVTIVDATYGNQLSVCKARQQFKDRMNGSKSEVDGWLEAAKMQKVAMSDDRKVRGGLEVLREQLDLTQIMKLIEGTAMWVDRETFDYLPVWFLDQARGDLMYKANWIDPQYNTNKSTGTKIHKQVGNTSANKALTQALGYCSKDRPNWTCCHIWGVDDDTYQTPNTVVSDKRYYSCVANMVLLPTPLKAFTDVMPEVKAMLRICAKYF